MTPFPAVGSTSSQSNEASDEADRLIRLPPLDHHQHCRELMQAATVLHSRFVATSVIWLQRRSNRCGCRCCRESVSQGFGGSAASPPRRWLCRIRREAPGLGCGQTPRCTADMAGARSPERACVRVPDHRPLPDPRRKAAHSDLSIQADVQAVPPAGALLRRIQIGTPADVNQRAVRGF